LYKIAFISNKCTTPFWWKAQYPSSHGMQEKHVVAFVSKHQRILFSS